MSILTPTGLETADYGTLGWNYIYSTNFQKINDFLSYFPRLWDISSYTNNDGDILVFSSATNSWSDVINKNDFMLVNDYTTNGKINLSVLLNEGITEISSDLTVDETYTIIIADASSNPITISLPANPTIGKKYIIKKVDNVNSVSITVDGTILIDGSTSISLDNQFDVITVVFSGSQYYII